MAVVFIAMALLGFLFMRPHTWLVLRDYDTGRQLARYPMEKGDSCSIEFTHSVNKTPVRDEYIITGDGTFHNVRCIYYGFGAGVQTALEGEETLRYEDGAMIIEGIEKYYAELTYGILPTSTHVLRVNGEEVFLPGLIEEPHIVVFCFERHLF